MTYLDAEPLAQDSGPGRAGNGPAIPTAEALTAHRPLSGPGPELTGGLLHHWQQRNRTASLPLALRQLEAAGNLDNLRAASHAAETSAQGRSAHLNRAPDAVHPATAAEGADAAEAIDASGSGGSGPRYHGPVFMDSDIYKTLEAIGWELARDPGGPAGADLASFAAGTAGLLEQAQAPDGYLDSCIQVSGEPRYSRLASSHEMYCAGHLIQAAVALARAAGAGSAGAGSSGAGSSGAGSSGARSSGAGSSGARSSGAGSSGARSSGARSSGAEGPGNTATAGRLMAVARGVADHLVATFGGREAGLDGHPVIETALAELYRATGHRAYLDLAAQFVSQRGHGLAGDSGRGHRYLQDHTPIRDMRTEEGHAVRAMYLEAGVVDVAAETGDTALLASSITRWEDMVATKTYLTGGNGSRHSDEAFGDRYELPPDRAYNETCAAIASFQWSWRLLLATGQARYADLMERVLYNAFGASISIDGQRFFYVSPLQRRHDHVEGDDPGRRHEWFSCACCPPNIMRLLASLQHYLATTDGDALYLQQYTGAQISTPLADGTLGVAVSADFPWSGEVTVRVTQAPAGPCGLAIRVPSWSSEPRLQINGTPAEASRTDRGYLLVHRQWQSGDVLAWTFDVAPRWAFPHPRINAVRGCAAIERGPLVYCFEQADQEPGTDLDDLALLGGTPLADRPATLPGIGRTVVVEVSAAAMGAGSPEGLPYAAQPPDTAQPPAGPGGVRRLTATAVPYFQWDNRDGRAMRVWLPSAG